MDPMAPLAHLEMVEDLVAFDVNNHSWSTRGSADSERAAMKPIAAPAFDRGRPEARAKRPARGAAARQRPGDGVAFGRTTRPVGRREREKPSGSANGGRSRSRRRRTPLCPEELDVVREILLEAERLRVEVDLIGTLCIVSVEQQSTAYLSEALALGHETLAALHRAHTCANRPSLPHRPNRPLSASCGQAASAAAAHAA